jgi:hypothetical protein
MRLLCLSTLAIGYWLLAASAMVGSFALAEGGSYLPTGPSMNAAKGVVHFRQAGSAEQVVALERLQVLDGLFKSSVQFRNGLVDVGLDRR